MTDQDLALQIWRAGVDAVGGAKATQTALQDWQGAPPDRILAVGKAAGAMAQAALTHFGPRPCLVVTKDGHGHGLPAGSRLIEAAHPVPDARSLAAGRALRDAIADMAPESTLLLLVSGGASSLAEDLRDGHELKDLAALNRRLLSEGLDIVAMNRHRRALSHIKGGGLLAGFRGARATVLAISDVPGDDLQVIGSGIGAAPGNPGFEVTSRIVASNAHARHAAAARAEALDLTVLRNAEILHDALPRLTETLGAALRAMPKGVWVLGGEPTVTLPQNPGRGGRNQALALALAREISGIDGLRIVVGGTDGSDGPTEAAGGIVDGATWTEAGSTALARADSGRFLEERGALLTTGPTGTNVMDLLVAVRS